MGYVNNMQLVTFNTHEKAEKCIFALVSERKIENQFTDEVKYLAWYESMK